METTLSEVGDFAGTDLRDALRLHNAALEQHVSDLEKSLENARKERDAQQVEDACRVADRERIAREALDRATKAEAERDAALADNAALVKKMRAVGDALRCGGFVDLTTGGLHPGAALLEELATLRTYAATAHSHEAWESLKAAHAKALEAERVRMSNALARIAEEVGHVGGTSCAPDLMAVLNGIERLVVRARNEGLERAREAVRAALTTGLLTPGHVRHAMREIGALKEPEL